MKAEYCDSETVRLLMRRMSPDNALALEVSLQTGLRIGDVLKLKTEELHGRTIKTTAQKTGKPITTTVTAKTANLLMHNAYNGNLFPSRKTGCKSPHKTRQAVYTDLRKSAEYYKIEPHISPHTARKVKAVEVYRKEGIAEAQKVLQHSDKKTTLMYCLSDLRQEIDDTDIKSAIMEILDIVKKLLQYATK